jgi:hypothetical protein
MPYIGLGNRKVTATPDTTGWNTGALTAHFTADIVGYRMPYFELYHAAIVDVPSNTTVTVYQGRELYTVAQLDTIGDWDPAQPMNLAPGTEIYVCFTTLAAVTPAPTVTAWFRYDPTLPNNLGK